MTVVAVCCARNEADLLEPLVRHTCRLVDRMVLLDDGSQDESLGILRQLVEEGLPLEVISQQSAGKDQRRNMTRLICDEAAVRLRADWIVALDADEFLCVPPGADLIPADPPADACFHLFWRGYAVTPDDDATEQNPVVRMAHRRKFEPQPTVKVLVPGDLARRPGAHIEQGNHHFWVGDERIESVPHPQAWLGHFPLRSAGQYLLRVAGTLLAYLSMPDRHPDWGWSCREPFEDFKSRPEQFESTLFLESRQYGIPHARGLGIVPEIIYDPFPYLGGPLRYTPPPMSLLRASAAVACIAEGFAFRHAVLSANSGDAGSEPQARILSTLQETLVARDRERSELMAQRQKLQDACQHEATLRRELEAACRSSSQEADARLAELQQRLSAALLERDDQLRLARGRVACLEEANGSLQASHAEALDRLGAAYRGSWTWRSGAAMLAPWRGLQGLISRIRSVLRSPAGAS